MNLGYEQTESLLGSPSMYLSLLPLIASPSIAYTYSLLLIPLPVHAEFRKLFPVTAEKDISFVSEAKYSSSVGNRWQQRDDLGAPFIFVPGSSIISDGV